MIASSEGWMTMLTQESAVVLVLAQTHVVALGPLPEEKLYLAYVVAVGGCDALVHSPCGMEIYSQLKDE